MQQSEQSVKQDDVMVGGVYATKINSHWENVRVTGVDKSSVKRKMFTTERVNVNGGRVFKRSAGKLHPALGERSAKQAAAALASKILAAPAPAPSTIDYAGMSDDGLAQHAEFADQDDVRAAAQAEIDKRASASKSQPIDYSNVTVAGLERLAEHAKERSVRDAANAELDKRAHTASKRKPAQKLSADELVQMCLRGALSADADGTLRVLATNEEVGIIDPRSLQSYVPKTLASAVTQNPFHAIADIGHTNDARTLAQAFLAARNQPQLHAALRMAEITGYENDDLSPWLQTSHFARFCVSTGVLDQTKFAELRTLAQQFYDSRSRAHWKRST